MCDSFKPAMKILESAGHQTVPIDLSSIDADPAKSGMDDDTKTIHDTITTIVESGKDMVHVAHLYGSLPTCNATEVSVEKSGDNGAKTEARRGLYIYARL